MLSQDFGRNIRPEALFLLETGQKDMFLLGQVDQMCVFKELSEYGRLNINLSHNIGTAISDHMCSLKFIIFEAVLKGLDKRSFVAGF